MKTLNKNELIEKLSAIRGANIVGLETLTDARARKTGNPFGQIFKHSRAVGFVGADYENGVNREAVRQGESPEFQAESLPWGTWVIPNKVIEHKGAFYLRTQSTPGQRSRQPARVLGYFAQGNAVEKSQIESFLPKRAESNKQQEETGIEKTVHVNTYSFNSIKKIRINGNTYKITD